MTIWRFILLAMLQITPDNQMLPVDEPAGYMALGQTPEQVGQVAPQC